MTVQILHGDCIERMRALPENNVHTCVTSPPYFGLRDYGVAGQIGLEPTPDEFVAKLVAVFREVRRVLRDDGTLWLNLGDSYAGSWGAQGRQGATGEMATRSVAAAREKSKISAAQIAAHPHRQSNTGSRDGYTVARPHSLRDGEPLLSSGVAAVDSEAARIKAKDLIGIPWRVAFALQADGWYLRQDIIWHKPNPMPESVRDRCTKAHEYIFLLAKSERYYFDAEAISEPVAASTVARLAQPTLDQQHGSDRVPGKTNGPMRAKAPRFGGHKYGGSAAPEHQTKSGNEYAMPAGGRRNKRSVWTVTTKPFKGAHFATFPPDLIEPCVLAGCPPGGTVLDPFGGAGTTGLVAQRHGRRAILCELNAEYIAIAKQRLGIEDTEEWMAA